MKTIQFLKKTLFLAIALLSTTYFYAQNPGDLDPTFGNEGKVVSPIGDDYYLVDVIQSIAVQPDGKIIAAGSSRESSQKRFTFVRYNQDGSLDDTFGNNGVAIFTPNNIYGNFIMGVEILPDGKIVGGGYVYDGSVASPAIIKLNEDGSLDETFGDGGMVFDSYSGHSVQVEQMKLQNDGKIVLAGYYDTQIMTLRYNADGTIDQSYGNNGLCVLSVGNASYTKGLAIQDDNKAVVCGFYYNGGPNKWAIVRINENGTPDETFGDNGQVLLSIGSNVDFANTVEIQDDGKILVGGHTWVADTPYLEYYFAVARLESNGTLDKKFGDNGIAIQYLEAEGENYINDIVVAPVSKNIYVAFTVVSEPGEYSNMGVMCMSENGVLNESFGSNGYASININNATNNAKSLAMQNDGKLVLGGEAIATNGCPFALARFITGEEMPAVVETNMFGDFEIYPNPTSEIINISYEDSEFSIQVYEAGSGRMVMTDENARTINISELSNGTYIIKLVSDKDVIIRNFVKL